MMWPPSGRRIVVPLALSVASSHPRIGEPMLLSKAKLEAACKHTLSSDYSLLAPRFGQPRGY
jgi:hypothetical protein